MARNNKLLVTGRGGACGRAGTSNAQDFLASQVGGYFFGGGVVSKGGLVSRWGGSPGTGPLGWCVRLSPKQLESVTFGG